MSTYNIYNIGIFRHLVEHLLKGNYRSSDFFFYICIMFCCIPSLKVFYAAYETEHLCIARVVQTQNWGQFTT